jgi:hypothetical protein
MRLPLLLLLTCCLAGCATDREQPAAPATPAPGARAAPPAPLDTTASGSADTTGVAWTDRPVEIERPTDEATLRAVRTAAHDGFDRVVFEFAEAALPAYHVARAEAPVRQCASGIPVALDGAHRLHVHFSRTRAHTDEGFPTVTDRDRTPDLPRLRALTLTCDFEGVVTWVLGLDTPGPFRVTERSDPTRLFVDVRR